ncbi:MAG: DsrE family protein, partial [Candidatus Lokiarchaeota archaeon]
LSGESLYSLLDGRTSSVWMNIVTNPLIKLYVDHRELQIMGIPIDLLKERYSGSICLTPENLNLGSNFWEILMEKIGNDLFDSRVGILQNEGPYMHRTSVYSVRLMNAALNKDLNTEFYGYLDGVHLGHKGQNPSEFENISQALLDIEQKANEKKLEFLMLSCSRCGTARGYLRSPQTQELYSSDDTIPHYYFCNLNKIIARFGKQHPIISSNSAVITLDFQQHSLQPSLIIFLTHNPYASEWTFGGISFAIASASHNIPTQVIFIENGVYGLIGKHQINEIDKIFNLQDIIQATADMENLEFYGHIPSFKKRNISPSTQLKSLTLIDNGELANIILKYNRKCLYHKRIIFF